MKPVTKLLPWALGVLAAFGCGAADDDPDAKPCRVDDDCELHPVKRACLAGRCADPRCPEGMLYVGAGSYLRGCAATDKDCREDSQPEHTVALTQGLCISKTELTVAEYRACVTAGRCQAPAELQCAAETASWTAQPGPNEKLPINCLRWSDAKAACEAAGRRLPTEAEWERAARGRDKRRFPWGEVAPTDCAKGANWGGAADCKGALWEAGSAKGTNAESAVGALEMAGNLWEWTADWFADDAYRGCEKGCTDPAGPASGVVRVRRGGSFQSPLAAELRASYREFHTPEGIRSDSQGVRCAARPGLP